VGGVVVGVDVGQRVDPTAIAVVQLDERPADERTDVHHLVRHLERLPLGTPYPRVVARVAEVVRGVRVQVRRRPIPEGGSAIARDHAALWRDDGTDATLTLYVDATGVGQPIVDLLVEAGLRPKAVYFTHGDRRTLEGREVRLGKAWLVSRLQALLQTDRIHLPETREARQLAKELLDYEIKVDQNANDTYGAFKVGSHDDLVTALGLAAQPPGRLTEFI
jgi:hypothetical protein